MSSYVRRWCLECRWQPQKRCWWATRTRSPEEPFCESYLENGAFRKTYSYIIHKTIYNKHYTSQLLSCRRPCGIRCGREEEKDPGSDDDEAGGDVVEEDVPVQFSSRWWTWKIWQVDIQYPTWSTSYGTSAPNQQQSRRRLGWRRRAWYFSEDLVSWWLSYMCHMCYILF